MIPLCICLCLIDGSWGAMLLAPLAVNEALLYFSNSFFRT